MKKLLVVLVLAMATVANAGLLLSVNGVVDPPDTEVFANPSDILNIDIHGDGETLPGAFYLGIMLDSTATSSVDISQVIFFYTGNANDIYFEEGIGEIIGAFDPVVHIELNDIPPVGETSPALTGKLIDTILYHVDGLGDVTLGLFDGEGALLDTQVIHIPEPITMVLLGLGGLMLRRRK